MVHGDAVVKRRRRDVVAGEPHMLFVAVDCIDGGIRRAIGERQCRVAERGPEFQNAPGVRRRRENAEQRPVVVRVGGATVLRAVLARGVADFRERIGRPFHGGRSLPARIVRALARDRHVVHVALAQAGAGDAHELGLARASPSSVRGADIAHRGAQAADELVQHGRRPAPL